MESRLFSRLVPLLACVVLPLSTAGARFSLLHSSLDGGGGPAVSARYSSESALVSIAGAGHIDLLREAPSTGKDFLTLPVAGSFTSTVSNLLANDLDLEGDAIGFSLLRTNTTHGGNVLILNGVLSYSPPAIPDSRGDSFLYVVTNGFGLGSIGKVVLVSPGAAPQLTGVERSKTNMTLRFHGLTNAAYVLQFRRSFAANTYWIDYSDPAQPPMQSADANGAFQFVIPLALGNNFFRAADVESLRAEMETIRIGSQLSITRRGVPNMLYKLQFRENLNSPDFWHDYPDAREPYTMRAATDGFYEVSVPRTAQNGFFRTIPFAEN
jgi:hypothetical protein